MNHSLIIFVLGFGIGLLQFREPQGTPNTIPTTSWPTTFEGRPIEPLPLSDKETSFACGFPGAIARFASPGGRQVILRQVTRATRKLHDSATCLRASGHRIGEGSVIDGWFTYSASRDGVTWLVRERIEAVGGEGMWTEISAWYWHALFHPSTGSWRAATVLDPI